MNGHLQWLSWWLLQGGLLLQPSTTMLVPIGMLRWPSQREATAAAPCCCLGGRGVCVVVPAATLCAVVPLGGPCHGWVPSLAGRSGAPHMGGSRALFRTGWVLRLALLEWPAGTCRLGSRQTLLAFPLDVAEYIWCSLGLLHAVCPSGRLSCSSARYVLRRLPPGPRVLTASACCLIRFSNS